MTKGPFLQGSNVRASDVSTPNGRHCREGEKRIADCLRFDFLPECHMMAAEPRDRRRTLRYPTPC